MKHLDRRLTRLERRTKPPEEPEIAWDMSKLTDEERCRLHIILMKASPFHVREQADENRQAWESLVSYLTAKHGDDLDGALDADELSLVCSALAWSEAIHQAARGWGLLPDDAPETLLCDPASGPTTTAVYATSANALEELVRAPCPR